MSRTNVYDDQEFWVPRIERAKRENKPHLSVYIGPWEPIVKSRVATIARYIAPHESLLDAGCAYGWLSQEVQNVYVGVDQTYALINYGRELYPKVDLQVMKLEELSFEDDEFDWVVCSTLKTEILSCEEKESMPKGKWERIETELLRVAKRCIIWPTYTPEYEILTRPL